MGWVVAAVLVLALGSTVMWFVQVRLRRESQASLPSVSASIGSPVVAVEGERSLVEPAFNPLNGLAFEDALDGERFALNVQRTTEATLAESARASGFQLGNVSIQMLSASRDGFIVTFDKGTAEFVKAANGAYKAQTRAPKGAFQEIGNIDQIGTWAHRAASVASITVAVANLISNADGSKKLGKLLDGQDRMFAYRGIDQYAALKTAYEDLREELSEHAPNPTSLKKIRSRIRNIRHVLMEEAKHDLSHLTLLYPDRKGLLKKPKKVVADWFKRKLTGAEGERLADLNKFRGKLLLARHCVTYENIAATASHASEHQAVLLNEAHRHLLQMLPRYQELESELQEVPDVANLLESMFESNRPSGEES